MKKRNLLNLSVSLSALCFSLPAIAMESLSQEETGASSFPVKSKATLQELIQEKKENETQQNDLLMQQYTIDPSLMVTAFYSLSDSSSPEFEEMKKKFLSLSQEREAIPTQIDRLTQRATEIDKELPEALLDYCRQKMSQDFLTTISPFTKETSLAKEFRERNHRIIQVPDRRTTKAPQTFYTDVDPRTGLYYGIELLQDNNISWWKERLGWEATMQFGKSCLEDFQFHYPTLMSSVDDVSLDVQIQQIFFPELLSITSDGTRVKILNQYELMSMRSTPIEDAPMAFQQAYENYTPNAQQMLDYLGAFRGFEMNLRGYKNAPTWVAYVSSEKVDTPLFQTLHPSSSSLKMMTTAFEGGPFYCPLGIFNSGIARASDSEPCSHLSRPFHSYLASKMGGIDSDIKCGTTRPLDPMLKIFKIMNLPFSTSWGNTPPDETLPTILREGNHQDKGGNFIPFNSVPYTPFVLFDPRSNDVYQIGSAHPFSTNYYLGGISPRDMQFPFITFDRETLANLYWNQ